MVNRQQSDTSETSIMEDKTKDGTYCWFSKSRTDSRTHTWKGTHTHARTHVQRLKRTHVQRLTHTLCHHMFVKHPCVYKPCLLSFPCTNALLSLALHFQLHTAEEIITLNCRKASRRRVCVVHICVCLCVVISSV